MKVFSLSALALTIMLNLGACIPPVHAASCLNNFRPVATWQTVPLADGRKYIKVIMQDQDYKARGAIYVVENNHRTTSFTSSVIELWMPKGAGTWAFFKGNLNGCGDEVNTESITTVEN